jgi:hypothetical protein
MNKYKCDHTPGTERTEDQHLDLICRSCLKAWMARHDALLAFVKETAVMQDGCNCGKAEKLLKEMGR